MPGEPILIVDDNLLNLKLIRVLLTAEGYEVRTAGDGPEAMAVLAEFRPRLILMDLQLPGIDGYELTRRLKAAPETRGILIVAVTASAMKGDEQRALEAGCDGYLAKPIDTRALPGIVARYMDAARATEAATSRRAPTVLVVEDNPTARKMVRVALQSAGYTVLEAEDGRAAIKSVASGAPDLVIQDLVLPDIEGIELLTVLRGLPRGREIPILAFSGLLSKLDEARASSVGFNDFLAKPLEPSRLLEIVASYLPVTRAVEAEVGHGRVIVAADDDPVHLGLLRLRLGELGFEVLTAPDGERALEAARNLAAPPAAIVSDVLMPGLDGFGLCLAVRRDTRLAGAPVILYSSAFLEEQERRYARAAGATAILVQTPDMREVVEALLAALRAGGPQPEASAVAEVRDEERTHRIIRQLERQVAMGSGLAQRCTLQAAELSILAGISEALTQTTEVESVLAQVLGRCLDAGEISAGALYVTAGVLAGTEAPTLSAAIGFTEAAAEHVAGFFGQADLLLRAASAGNVVVIPSDDVPADRSRLLLERAGARSALLAPVSCRDERFGVLLLASRTKELGNADHRGFARSVAAQIGQAHALASAFAQAQEAIRLRDEFLSIASHELKTPLTALSLEVQSLGRSARRNGSSAEPGPAVTARLSVLERQLARLTKLIDNLLDISRVTMGRLAVELESLDLSAVVRDVCARHAQQLAQAGCPLELDAAAPVIGTWDRLRLEQVITNLVTNAMKYGSGRPITISVKGDGATAQLVVSDAGIGISAADQLRIFERFERAVSVRHYGGFGLGLWIARQIVEALGGKIRVESELGSGATFTMELPQSASAPATQPQP